MQWQVAEREAYGLLAEMAVAAWGELPEMERGERGKPWFPAWPERQFSLSHSGLLSLCVLDDRPVGGDVERIRPRRAGFPRYVLSQREYDWFLAQGGDWGSFYTLWTMKEARVKCTGTGLDRPPREISVPLLLPGQEGQWEGFSFTALAGPGWRGAICREKDRK